jgi:N6-adenosine-specific RNA methylase IME4/ParB-like chromosome segregation protein Spo0J
MKEGEFPPERLWSSVSAKYEFARWNFYSFPQYTPLFFFPALHFPASLREAILKPMEEEGIETGQYAEAMPDLAEEQYAALKRSIAEHGLEYPILVDRTRTVIDGHHRLKACRELGIEPETIVVDTEDDPERAYRPNLARRDFSSGAKREAVKQYLLEHWEGERSEKEVATDLGVSQFTVNRARRELREAGKLTEVNDFSTAEKRQQVREYLAEYPEASNREVAEAVEADVSHASVGNWRNEWEEEGEEEDRPLKAYAPNPDQAGAAAEVFREKEDEENPAADTASEQAERLASGETTPERAQRVADRERRRAENEPEERPELPEGTYSVIYADPPWNYENRHRKASHPDQHYAAMSDEEIKSLDVPAAEDTVLFLWATAPRLPLALEVMEEWGFEYKTQAVWDKEKIGMGYWFRGRHELLLVGVRGDMSPPQTEHRRPSVIRSERKDHSQKPEGVSEWIEDAFPPSEGHRLLELFSREAREGWTVWGNEV